MSTHLAACALAVSLAAASLSIGEQRKYVTVDPSGDLDVAFPERLGLPDVHIGLPNQNVPEVHVSVAAQQAGLVFDYALENGEAARQPIISWYLVLPAPDLVNRVEDPQLWKSLRVIPTPADRRALYYVQPPGFFLRWHATQDEGGAPGPIAPGASAHFRVVASAKPGFLRSYYFSGYASTPPDIPNDVYLELRPFLTLDGSSQQRLVLGPAFAPDTPKRTIARALLGSVANLVERWQLDGRSEFIIEARTLLLRLAADNAAATAPALTLRTRPAGETEQQVLTTMEQDFSVSITPRFGRRYP
jgi:hypothetical protein